MSENPLIKIDLIDFGKLSRPATVLIERISNAVGTFFQPYQVIRLAKAEAEAERIREDSRIEVGDLERRAVRRWMKEEAKKQSNIEDITTGALPLLNDKSAPEQLQDDWITHFFDGARLISDTEMQRLWSAVLAAEANEPGSFSKRTVNLMADLDKFDAELFTRVCDFGWNIEGDEIGRLKGRSNPEKRLHVVPIVRFMDDAYNFGETYATRGITYASLTHLESLGLLRFGERGFWWRGISKKTTFFYFGKAINVEFPKPNYPGPKGAGEYGIEVGHVLLTRAGFELAQVCKAVPVEGFYKYNRDRWQELGIVSDKTASE